MCISNGDIYILNRDTTLFLKTDICICNRDICIWNRDVCNWNTCIAIFKCRYLYFIWNRDIRFYNRDNCISIRDISICIYICIYLQIQILLFTNKDISILDRDISIKWMKTQTDCQTGQVFRPCLYVFYFLTDRNITSRLLLSWCFITSPLVEIYVD